MPKKVILFLSDYKSNNTEHAYRCPDPVGTVTGTQTNDAPVRYLLRAYPDISEILCIVTPKARAGAWDLFVRMVGEDFPNVKLTDIPFDEGQEFSGEALSKIMASVSAKKNDEILLETTGGFRNAVMHLLLVSRALSYSGIPTVGAVYSNYPEGRVEDVSHLIGLFELVGGMQELASFGSVHTLRTYYRTQKQPVPEIASLLNAMEALSEDITLCRTARLDGLIEKFNTAIDQAGNCADPLMNALLPAFRAKFDKKLSIPGLIKWCINNDMLQQALTIYKERIPAYLFRHPNGIFAVKSGTPLPENIPDYQTVEEAIFREQLLGKWKLMRFGEPLPTFDLTWDSRYPESQLQDIVRDYLYIRLLRNMINHANDQNIQSEGLMEYLVEFNYKNVNDVKTGDIKQALLRGLERLQPPKRKGKRN